MAWTANDIKNLILMELNHETINNWNDKLNTDIVIINTQYALARKAALSRYQWSFAVKHVEIELEEPNETIDTPNSKYKYVAYIPDDALCDFVFYNDQDERSLADYYVVGNKVCANVEKLYMVYTYDCPECQFTTEFVDWFKVFAAERLNGYLNGDMQRQQLLAGQEPMLFRTAKNIDCKRNKHESISNNPLLAVRGNKHGYIG